MNEVILLLEEAHEVGFTAKGLGVSIFTQAASLEELREAVKDAVRCHFDDCPQQTSLSTLLTFKS